MKRLLVFTVVLMIVSIPTNADYLVKTIYFKPNNVDNVPFEKIRGWMDDVHHLYIDEMSKHGYGSQTFELEREHNGNVKVNIVNGDHPSWIYQSNTEDNVSAEIPQVFKDQKNVHVFILGGINTINSNRGCCQWGAGWPIYNFNFGGGCYVAENADTDMVSLIAHEIGHSFSLYHNNSSSSFMGQGRGLLEYEARWLSMHYFFNPNRVITWQHPKVNRVFNVEEVEPNIINIKISIESPNNLHQVVVMDSNILVLGWKYINGEDTNLDLKLDRSKLIGKSRLTFMTMDIFGAFNFHYYNFTMPPRFIEDVVVKEDTNRTKNEDIGVDIELDPITIKEDTSKNVVYLNINSGKKTLPDDNGLKPFNHKNEYKNGWGWQVVSDNKTNNGNPIVIRNATFERGISLSPPDLPEVSSLKYNLEGNNYTDIYQRSSDVSVYQCLLCICS